MRPLGGVQSLTSCQGFRWYDLPTNGLKESHPTLSLLLVNRT